MTYKGILVMPYFYHAEYTNLVWSVYHLLAILGRKLSGFGTPLLLVQYIKHGQRPEEVSKHDIYPWK